ncbi:MAG: S49 family peptidase [Candidatus Babeliaceae bacterium]
MQKIIKNIILAAVFCGSSICTAWQVKPHVMPESFAVQHKPEKKEETKIGVLKILGEISIESGEKYTERLYDFAHDNAIKAILLIIDSGGGAAGIGDLVFREVKALSSIKPVVVLVAGWCCSAAYHIALGGNWIIMPASATVGSIGVYHMVEKHTNSKYTGKTYSADVEFDVVYAGKYKVATHPDALPLDEEGRALLQESVNRLYKNFITVVAQERNLSIDNAPEWAEGRHFDGARAVENKLVDQVGGFSDALEKVRELITTRGGSASGKFVFVY